MCDLSKCKKKDLLTLDPEPFLLASEEIYRGHTMLIFRSIVVQVEGPAAEEHIPIP